MAISTIASDKAVYKRMFVDWVVGMIMLFTLHYFMIFVVTLNGIAVGIVEKSANEVNKASLQQASQSLGLNLHDELHSKLNCNWQKNQMKERIIKTETIPSLLAEWIGCKEELKVVNEFLNLAGVLERVGNIFPISALDGIANHKNLFLFHFSVSFAVRL